MPDELTPAERIADNIINGNISDAKRALRACSKRTVLDVVFALTYREAHDAPVSLAATLNRVARFLP